VKCVERDGKVLWVSNLTAEKLVKDKGYRYANRDEHRKYKKNQRSGNQKV